MPDKRKDSKGRILKTGEGQRKDGTYQYRYNQGKKRFVVYASNLTELRDKESQIQKDLADGIDYRACKVTVTELSERYLSLKSKLKQTTLHSYLDFFKLVKESEFGNMKICDVKMSDAKKWILDVYDKRRSYNSMHTIKTWMYSVFNMAYQDCLIRTNPFDFKTSSIIKNDTIRRQPLTTEQQDSLISFLRGKTLYSKYYEEIYILLNTGLRAGEFCGLTVDSLDFEHKRIIVNKQLQRTNDCIVYVESLKTKSSYRVLPMTDEVERCFKYVLSRDIDKRNSVTIDGYTGFLFFNTQGNPKTLRNLQNTLHNVITAHNKVRPDCQIPQITPHVLRHTFCTNLINAGLGVKDVQYLMGHSSATITLDVYSHVDISSAGDNMIQALEGKVLLHHSGRTTTPLITPFGVKTA